MIIQNAHGVIEKMKAAVKEKDPEKQKQMIEEIMNSPELEWFKQTIRDIWETIKKVVIALYEEVKKVIRLVRKQIRIDSFKRQRIKYKRWC